MTRPLLSVQVDDLSDFARRLRRELTTHAAVPGHLGLMNMIARSAGYRNLQHLRAGAQIPPAPPAATAAPPVKEVAQVLRHFGPEGKLARWPARTAQQHLALWAVWARLPKGPLGDERAFTARLKTVIAMDDPAILRRTMVQRGLIARDARGLSYARIEQPPPPEARALLAALAPHGG